MKPLYLDWNLGLGDSLICNGLVRWLSEYRAKRVVLPCYEHNFASVQQLFQDIPGVSIHQLLPGEPNLFSGEVLPIGLNNPRWGTVQPFDRAFYEFAGVPFDAKWDLFSIPRSGRELPPKDYRYALVHDDKQRGFAIDESRISPDIIKHHVFKSATPRISDWRDMISEAAEVHVIDSAVMHLAELLPTKGKLFYHRYARRASERMPVDATFRKDWTVLD